MPKWSLVNQKRKDLLKALLYFRFLGSGTSLTFLPPLLWLFLWLAFKPRMGLNNFFRTLPKPYPRRPCLTWVFISGRSTGTGSCGGADAKHFDWGRLGSERLLRRMAWFSCTSNESLSNWSSSVLCSSPNLLNTTSISSTLLLFLLLLLLFLILSLGKAIVIWCDVMWCGRSICGLWFCASLVYSHVKCQMEGFKDILFKWLQLERSWVWNWKAKQLDLSKEGKRIKEIVAALKLQRLSNQREVLQYPRFPVVSSNKYATLLRSHYGPYSFWK